MIIKLIGYYWEKQLNKKINQRAVTLAEKYSTKLIA